LAPIFETTTTKANQMDARSSASVGFQLAPDFMSRFQIFYIEVYNTTTLNPPPHQLQAIV
jgi:hypothetical protein